MGDDHRADVAEEEQFGPYLVYERLGVGGMATVHRALERGIEGFERMVALKRLLPHLAEDASFIKSFVREAKLASLLNHVNIVQIFELGRVGTEYFISMEYIDGRDVRRVLRHARKVTGPPAIHVTVGMLLQLCDALDYAHSKVDEEGHPLRLVHRDISPSNLLITNAGHLKIIDFGIAKAQSSQLRTQTGRVKGKLAYMAPEAISGKDLDARSDLWAVGVIAHELLTARPLFASKNEYQTLVKVQREPIAAPSTFNQACPPELDAIVAKALARDPDERYASASELRDALIALRIKHSLQTGYRDIAGWLDWAFSVEAPSGGFAGVTGERSETVGAFDGRGGTPLPRSRRADEDEAVEIAWGGAEPEDNNGPVVLDDVPDVSEKHYAQPPPDPISFGDDIPPPQPSHGARPSVPSLAGARLRTPLPFSDRTLEEELGVDVDLDTPPMDLLDRAPATDPVASLIGDATNPSLPPAPERRATGPIDTERNPVVKPGATPPPVRATPLPVEARKSSIPTTRPSIPAPPPGAISRNTPPPMPSADRARSPSAPPPPPPPPKTPDPDSVPTGPRRTPSSPPKSGKIPATKPGFVAPARRSTSVPPEITKDPLSTPPATATELTRPRRSANISIGQAIVDRDKPKKTWVLILTILLLGGAATAVTLYVTQGADHVEPIREPTPEPAPKKTGKLAFIIEPADAKITIEGMPAHEGSPWATEVPAGDYNITIEREGWKPYLANVSVDENEKQNFRWRLDPLDTSANPATADATLILSSNPAGLEAILDGKPLPDRTPLRMSLAPGPHTIVLRDASGAEVWKQAIAAKPSTSLELSPDVEKIKARAQARSDRRSAVPAQNPATIDRARPTETTRPTPDAGIASVTAGLDHPATNLPMPITPTTPTTPTPPVPVTPKPPPPPTGEAQMVPPNKLTKLSGEVPKLAVGKGNEMPTSIAAKLCIDTSGKVTKVELITKLERHAASDLVDAMERWKYAPYKDGGVAKAACIVVSFKTR